MGSILSEGFFISLLAGTIRISIPILFAALGEIYTQRSGILNLGIEGIMIIGALSGFVGTFFTGSLLVGLLSAMFFGFLYSLIMGFLSITIKANQVIAGTALSILGASLASFLYRVIFGVRKLPPTIKTFSDLDLGFLSRIPVLGPILFRHNIMVYLALALVLVTWFVLEKTTFGLKVKAVGEYPRAADSKGVHVNLIRYICVSIGGVYAGLGGAFLSIGFMNTYMDHMIAGRGFIAVAVVIFSRWNPYRALTAALIFGGANALQMRLQSIGVEIPNQLLLSLPYILTILVLVGVSKKAEFPAAFTIPYSREEK